MENIFEIIFTWTNAFDNGIIWFLDSFDLYNFDYAVALYVPFLFLSTIISINILLGLINIFRRKG